MFALLLRYFTPIDLRTAHGALFLIFAILAIASMVVGNLLALLQTTSNGCWPTRRSRTWAICWWHFWPAALWPEQRSLSIWSAYFVTTIGAFGVVTVLSSAESEAEEHEDFRGSVLAAPMADRDLHRDASVPGGNPTDRRVRRQVLPTVAAGWDPPSG